MTCGARREALGEQTGAAPPLDSVAGSWKTVGMLLRMSSRLTFSGNTMPHLIRISLLIVLALGPLSAGAAEVSFPDENFEEVIRQILKKKQIEEEKITDDHLKKIYFLDAKNRGIRDLTGIDHCINLAEVKLSDNEISDLAPIAKCGNIQSLYLTGNKITDISPLGELVKLQHIELDSNEISDIAPLAKLKALASLYLDHNRIKSVKPLAGLPKLQSLYLANNKIQNLKPLGTIRWLSSLDLSSNQIVDVTPLTQLTELRWTFLMQNKIADISPLVEMAKKDIDGDNRFAPFWKLYLAKNPLSDESKSRHLKELRDLQAKHGGPRLDLEYLRKRR